MKMTKPKSTSQFMDKVSGAIADGLSKVLTKQSDTLEISQKYEEKFLSSNRLPAYARVYIDEETHQLLTRIASAVGKDKASLGAYVTAILRDHVERNKDAINAIYLTHTQPLF